MVTPLIIFAFPLLVTLAYGALFLLRGRDEKALRGRTAFALYLLLISIPFIAVALADDIALEFLDPRLLSPVWLVAGVGVGMLLAGFQLLTLPRSTSPSQIWTGPRGWVGFVLLMFPVAYIVLAEEVVWRGYLAFHLSDRFNPVMGLVVSSLAFALHHCYFGVRHVLFTFAAGVVWASLFFLEEGLYAAIGSHLAYNVFAWAWLRQASTGDTS